MKKRYFSALLCMSLMVSGFAQSLHFNWGFNLGKTAINTSPTCGHSFSNGDLLLLFSVFPAGSTLNDSMNINPLGTAQYTKFSSTVARYDANGALLWFVSWRTPFSQSGISLNNLRVAPDNSFWVSGTITGTGDADPDTGVYMLSSKGNTDVFVAHLSTDGKLITAFTIGSANPDTYESIAHCKIDGQGNVYLFGNVVNDGVDFDPGTGETRLWGFGTDATGNFLAKYSPQGNLIYVRPFTFNLICLSMSVSGIGEVVLLGRSRIQSKPVDMDPGNAEKVLNGRQVIAAYDDAGNLKWGYDYTVFELTTINSDAAGNLYVAGSILPNTSAADIDFSFNTQQLQASAGGTFLATYSKDGVMLWHGQFGMAQNSYITGTNNAMLYFAGLHISGDYVYAQFNYKGSGVDVDPGAAQYLISSERTDELSTGIMRYNRHNGQFSKAFSIGVQSLVSGLYYSLPSFDVASESNFYLITLFNYGINQMSQVDADPHPQNTFMITRNGNNSILLAHYSFDYIHVGVAAPDDSYFTLFPNPVSEKCYVQVPQGEKVMYVNLSSIDGKQSKAMPYQQLDDGSVALSLGNFSKGIYFLYLTTTTNHTVIKLVKE